MLLGGEEEREARISDGAQRVAWSKVGRRVLKALT